MGQDHWSNQGHGMDCVWSKLFNFSVTWEKCKFSQGPLAGYTRQRGSMGWGIPVGTSKVEGMQYWYLPVTLLARWTESTQMMAASALVPREHLKSLQPPSHALIKYEATLYMF